METRPSKGIVEVPASWRPIFVTTPEAPTPTRLLFAAPALLATIEGGLAGDVYGRQAILAQIDSDGGVRVHTLAS